MKILLIAIAGLLLLILIVVAIGAMLPERHVVSRSASYRAKPETLFALIAGPQNWRPDVLSSEFVSDSAGKQLLRETTRDKETITYELTDSIPPTSLKRRIATQNLPFAGTWTYSLQPSGDTTIIRITEDGQVFNPVFRFVSRFILGQTTTIDAYLRALGKATSQEITIQN